MASGTRVISFVALLVALLVTLSAVRVEAAGLLEGLAAQMTSYERNELIYATVDSFRSRRGLIPFNFYSIPIPKPDEARLKKEHVKENLGRILLGSREQPSEYAFHVGVNVSCVQLGVGNFTESNVNRALYLAKNRYFGSVTLDSLPVVSEVVTSNGKPAMRLGYSFGEDNQINNFLHFRIMYIETAGVIQITGFAVLASSYAQLTSCASDELNIGAGTPFLLPTNMRKDASISIPFFYSVSWVPDPTGSLTFRSDIYERTAHQKQQQSRGHWTAAINAVLLAVLLGVAVAVVIARTVRRDLLQYADGDLADDLHEETGWKLVRGDVYRPPRFPVAFTCLIAAGSQTLVMFATVLLASLVGILHHTQRGNLLTGLIVCFLLSSFAAGYVGARMLKLFRCRSWANGIFTVTVFPVSLALGYMSLNMIHWSKHSASAIPFTTLLLLLILWLALSLPLGIAGVTMGFRADTISVPTKVNTIPRLIPAEAKRQVRYHIVFGGLVPFSACFIELVFVLGAFWQGERFYMLGFLSAVSVVVAVLCGEIAIVVTYLALNEEDYRWWWRSFLSLASAGAYLFLYSVFYLVVYLELRLFSSVVLFLGYTVGISALFAIMCGTVGFLSAAAFTRVIYTAAKSD